MTMISRVLGLVRDVVIANMIGTSAGADVYFFANRIPNFLRRLFAEGAFAQAFVPVMAEVREKEGDDKVRELLAKVSGTLGGVVTVVTLLGVLGSSVIVAIFAFNWFLQWFNGDSGGDKFELASLMLKITFPYLWFVTLVALSGAILNTYNKFAVAAFTPVFLNISIICCAWLLSPYFDVPAMSLAVGVFIGGLVQFLFQLPFLAKQGLLVRPRWAWQDENVKKIRTLMLPALFGVSVNQINMLVDTLIASFLVTGSISWLYYADRLIEFPLGLFGIGIATVILPTLSRQHVSKDPKQFSRTMDWGVRFIAVLGVPAMVGLIVLAKPIIAVLYLRGEFSESAVDMVSYSLIAYACGLLSYMMIKVLAPGYYSRQDIKTPVRIGIIAMVANMGLNLILVWFLAYVGLALATALSATLNAFLLYRGLKNEQVYQFSAKTLRFFIKLIVAAAAMAILLVWLTPGMERWFEFNLISKISWLAFIIGCGASTYLAALLVLGVRSADFKSAE